MDNPRELIDSHNLSAEPWDEFIRWARRFYLAEDFDANEREYKLRIALRLQEARDAMLDGDPDWIARLERAFGHPNNLTDWRTHSPFLDWCKSNEDQAASSLRIIWDEARSVADRIDDFVAAVPAEAVQIQISLASFLQMAVDPHRFPIFRATPVTDAMNLTGFPNPHRSGRTPAGTRYEHYLAFLDRIIEEARLRGLELRDRLDAQSVLWAITRLDPSDEWTEEECAAFRAYRGQHSRGADASPVSADHYDTPTQLDISHGHTRLSAGRTTWWVNQGSSYVQQRDGEYLWAPKQSKSGTTFSHWMNMTKLRVGDVVIHYANTAIRAISIIQGPVEEARRPTDLPGDQWLSDGFFVKSQYFELSEPIALSDIPLPWRESGPGPFTQQGGIKQEYLFQAPEQLLARLVARFPDRWPEAIKELDLDLSAKPGYQPPQFGEMAEAIRTRGLRIAEQTLRRYHLSLSTRGFVILAGVSGTGKTWLAEAYAQSVGARYTVVAVAPNWTTNEDLLGYFNPLTKQFHDTGFSRFLREAAEAYTQASTAGLEPVPYHLVLDEMNLARVEYYFASFLSAMEVRARQGAATLDLGPGHAVTLPPNLFVIGTVNVDETTHGFADKVYDRAQLVEVTLRREDIADHLAGRPYRDDVLAIWDAVAPVGPFAYRVLDEIAAYIEAADTMGVPWEIALDEQIVQKVLPKLNGAKPGIEAALERTVLATVDRFPLASARAQQMLEGFHHYGFASYFA